MFVVVVFIVFGSHICASSFKASDMCQNLLFDLQMKRLTVPNSRQGMGGKLRPNYGRKRRDSTDERRYYENLHWG